MRAKLSTPSRPRVVPKRAAGKRDKGDKTLLENMSRTKPPPPGKGQPLAGARHGPAQPVRVTRPKRKGKR